MDTTRWDQGYPESPVSGQEYPPETPETDMPEDPESPFEEPEMAPELRQQRSESLYSRSTPFWDRVVELPAEGEAYPLDPEYWNHPEEIRDGVIMRVEALRPMQKLQRFLTSRAAMYLAAALVLLTVMAFLAHSVFATVRSISVEGNVRFTDEQVIACSGLTVGMSTFDIDAEAVIERIGREERYLRCTLVDVSYDKVTIHVRERVPVCCVVQNGQLIVLDDRGWVLEIHDDLSTPTNGLISVSGLEITERHEGQVIGLRVPSRLTVYTQILIELRAMGGLELITELDLTTMDSITMKTEEGLTVLLGSESSVHEKLRAMLVVRENLLQNGYYGKASGGTIIVSDPGSPAYRPPDGK